MQNTSMQQNNFFPFDFAVIDITAEQQLKDFVWYVTLWELWGGPCIIIFNIVVYTTVGKSRRGGGVGWGGDHSSLLLWAPNVFSCSYVRKRSAEVQRWGDALLCLIWLSDATTALLLSIGWSLSTESSGAAWWVFRKHTLCSIRDLWLHSTSTWQGKPLHKQSCVNSPRSGIVDPQTDSLHGGCSTWI